MTDSSTVKAASTELSCQTPHSTIPDLKLATPNDANILVAAGLGRCYPLEAQTLARGVKAVHVGSRTVIRAVTRTVTVGDQSASLVARR